MNRLTWFAVVIAMAGVVSTYAAGQGKKAEKRELLAEHKTIAIFQGSEYQLCRGLTALCPKECDGSGEFANFKIVRYLSYKKTGQYGDPKQESFSVRISDYYRKPVGDAAVQKTVAGLTKGDYVLLDWNHDYVTIDGSSSPERPLTKLEKISKEKAEELLQAKPPGDSK